MLVPHSAGRTGQLGQQSGDEVGNAARRRGTPLLTIRVLHREQCPLGQGQARHLRKPRGHCKISNVGDDDVQHGGRNVRAGQVQQRLGIRIFVGEGIVGRSLAEVAGDIAFRHHDGTDVAAGVDVFPLGREEVQQPAGFIAAQQAGVLLELAVGIYAVLLTLFLDFCDVVRMLSVQGVGTVGTEAVQTAQ